MVLSPSTSLRLLKKNADVIRLYIIEGIITVIVAVACYWLIPNNFETAYFLNENDKKIMRRRAELTESYNGGQGHYTRKDIMMAVKDSKTWLHGLIQFACMTVVYGKYTTDFFLCLKLIANKLQGSPYSYQSFYGPDSIILSKKHSTLLSQVGQAPIRSIDPESDKQQSSSGVRLCTE